MKRIEKQLLKYKFLYHILVQARVKVKIQKFISKLESITILNIELIIDKLTCYSDLIN